MTKKRDIAKEIILLKSRDEFSANSNYRERLHKIENLLKNINNDEVLRYIPIALVACFESFFRSNYAEIIDFGDPYRKNVKNFNNRNIKLDLDILSAIDDKEFSVGELISHMLPCNNVYDIDSNISILLDNKFLKSIKSFYYKSIFEDINEMNSIFREKYNSIIEDIKKIFELRHIFCHEIANNLNIEKSEIESLFFSANIFLENADLYIWNTLYPNAPETQAEMNYDAERRAKILDQKFEEYINIIKSHDFFIDMGFNLELFCESINRWKEYRKFKAETDASTVEGGSMYPNLFYYSFAETTERKIKELEEDYKQIFKLNNEY